MKRIIVLFLAVFMTFSVVGCSVNNDENNATVLSKINEMEKEAQEVTDWHIANGYFEGIDAAEFKEINNTINEETKNIQSVYQENVDNGGYDDEMLEATILALDELIQQFDIILEDAKKLHPDVLIARSAAVLIVKHDLLTELVNEVLELGERNGWEEDQEYFFKLDEMMNTVTTVTGLLENLETMDSEQIDAVISEYDAILPVWQESLILVSTPYSEILVETTTQLSLLIEKHTLLVEIVNQGYIVSQETGWIENAEFLDELDTTLAFLEVLQEDINNPEYMDQEYIGILIDQIDLLIPIWEGYLVTVSEPYE